MSLFSVLLQSVRSDCASSTFSSICRRSFSLICPISRFSTATLYSLLALARFCSAMATFSRLITNVKKWFTVASATFSVALRNAALASEKRTGSMRLSHLKVLTPNTGCSSVRATGTVRKRSEPPSSNCRI